MMHNVNRLIPRSTMSYRVSNRHFLIPISTHKYGLMACQNWLQLVLALEQSSLKSLRLCKQLDCRKSSWGVHLSFSKYQADVLCFYYYKYLTHACCTWVAYVSKISNESLQLLNCSKNYLIEALYTYCGSNKGGIQTNKR